MTVMSEGLLLNSKYIKMGLEEGVFKLSSHNHLLLAVIHLRFCDGLKRRCSISCQAKSVSNSCQANI